MAEWTGNVRTLLDGRSSILRHVRSESNKRQYDFTEFTAHIYYIHRRSMTGVVAAACVGEGRGEGGSHVIDRQTVLCSASCELGTSPSSPRVANDNNLGEVRGVCGGREGGREGTELLLPKKRDKQAGHKRVEAGHKRVEGGGTYVGGQCDGGKTGKEKSFQHHGLRLFGLCWRSEIKIRNDRGKMGRGQTRKDSVFMQSSFATLTGRP